MSGLRHLDKELGEISGSNGEYEDDSFRLGCCAVYSGRYWSLFSGDYCLHHRGESLMRETLFTSETSVRICQTTRRLPDNRSGKILWNVGQYLPDCTALHLSRLPPSSGSILLVTAQSSLYVFFPAVLPLRLINRTEYVSFFNISE
jgi:hypothetical protein